MSQSKIFRRFHLAIVVIGLVFTSLGLTSIASARPMTSVDMVELTRLSRPAESPDGRFVVYLQRETDWKQDRHKYRYVLYDTQGQQSNFILKAERKGERFHRVLWSPDSKSFLVTLKSKLDDKGLAEQQVYRFSVHSKKLERLSAHHTRMRSIKWRPDGSGFYFLSTPKKQSDNDVKIPKDILVVDQPSPYELWYFDLQHKDLQHKDLQHKDLQRKDLQGNKSRRIIGGDFSVRGYELSMDSSVILYARGKKRTIDSRHSAELWLYHTDTGKHQKLTTNAYAESGASLSPNKKTIAYIARVNAKGEAYYDANLFIQSVGAPKPTLLLPNKKFEVEDVAWGANSETLYVLANTGLRSQLFVYSLASRTLRALSKGDHAIKSWRYNPKTQHHVFILQSAQSPGEVFRMDREGAMHQLSHVHANLGEKFSLPRQQAFTWNVNRKTKLEGLLVYPLNYTKGKRFPLVTITHGGPLSSSQFGSWNVSRYLAVFSAQGYGVFLPNHRGGTGYGDAFMRDMLGGYFNNADKDVMKGIDALIDKGLVDESSLVKHGWSAGGHMTNWLITQTQRFKAASSGAGVADWVSLYGESDTRYMRGFVLGGSPWQKRAPLKIYKKNSPLFYAHNIKTPTLFWTGENDRRVPPTQSILMYRAARAAGAETQLYMARGEPHNFLKPSHQLFKINTELAWYARHLGLPQYRPNYPR